MTRISPETVEKIRQAREDRGLSLDALTQEFGIKRSRMFTIIRGMRSDNVKQASPTRRVVLTKAVHVERPSLSKSDIGEAARQIICARMMLAGVKVFRPMSEDTPTDLLVLRGDGSVAKIQCKYLYPHPSGCHIMPLKSVRKNGPGSKAVVHVYTPEEVDFFAGYCLDSDKVYILPFSAAGGRSEVRVWVAREPRGGNGAAGVDLKKWADAFDQLK